MTATQTDLYIHHRDPWTPAVTHELIKHYLDGVTVPAIAKILKRRPIAVESKLGSLRKRGDLTLEMRPQSNVNELSRNDKEVAEAEARMLDQIRAMGGFPVSREIIVPATGRSLTVHFGYDNKPHPLWLAKHMPEGIAA